MVGGINFDETFVMYLDVASVDDGEVVLSVLQQSKVWGAHLERTYSDIHCGYKSWGSVMGYRCAVKICNTDGQCLNELFWEENQKKGRAKACWSFICKWGETLNELSEAPASSLIDVAIKLGGNRGTGLSPGSWKLDGGVMVAGVNWDETFEMYLDVASIGDAEIVVSVLQSSFIWGSHLKETSSNIHCPYTDWGSTMGYRCQVNLCNENDDCLSELFWEENQKKGRAKACWGWLCKWGETLNEVSEAPASLVAEAAVLRGNRGTGLSPGSWKLDGGVMVGGMNVDQTFEMYLDVASISDDEIVFSVLEKSYIWGSHLNQTYSDMHCSYTSWGGRSSQMGYRCETKICNTDGHCLNQLFWEENQKKGRAKACWSFFCKWGETKNEVSRAR